VYEELRPLLFSIAYRMVGSTSDAEDIVQEAFLRFHREARRGTQIAPSRSDWTDEAPNLSRADPSGADQIDAERRATDLAVGGSNPSRRATITELRGPIARSPVAVT